MSERDRRTIANIARCLLKDAGFPKYLWGEMFFTATYLANRMPHSVLQTQAPFTVLFGVQTKLDHLRSIAARAVVHIETHTTKREDKAWEGRLCGNSMNRKAYRIYNSNTRRVTESRNVIFIETPVSTLIDPYTSNNNDDAGDPQEDSSSSGNTADISITDHDEVPRLLRNCWTLPPRISTSQLARRRRHLETALRQKYHAPEPTGAHRRPTRLRQEHNLRVANKEELLA